MSSDLNADLLAVAHEWLYLDGYPIGPDRDRLIARAIGMARAAIAKVEGSARSCNHSITERGSVYEACLKCGAVRRLQGIGKPQDPWHTCHLCKLP